MRNWEAQLDQCLAAKIDVSESVAIVTGAGGGLGRAHALELGSRRVRVVVNDLGVGREGEPGGSRSAEHVAAEIRAGGGQAIANADTVATAAGAASLVRCATEAFGRVDILVNNAGFLRDRSFRKMDLSDFEAVLDVHLMGSVRMCHAVWPVMLAQAYGRIVNTTSAAGLYGNFGQSNYAAAKMGLVGLTLALALEGARHGIRVNAIAPVAGTRMTEGAVDPAITEATPPALVAPAVTVLSSRACSLTGTILVAGGGHFAVARVMESAGLTLPPDEVTAERVASELDASLGGEPTPRQDALDALAKILERIRP